MTDNFKTFRNKVLDPRTPFSEVRRLFCQLIREHASNLPLIIRALGLLYAHRSVNSKPPLDDAQRIFRKILLPLLEKNNALVAAFYLMLADPHIPNICLLTVINRVKKEKDPWWLIGVAATLRPSFADRFFRRRVANPKQGSRTT